MNYYGIYGCGFLGLICVAILVLSEFADDIVDWLFPEENLDDSY